MSKNTHLEGLINEFNALSNDQKLSLMNLCPELYINLTWLVRTEEIKCKPWLFFRRRK